MRRHQALPSNRRQRGAVLLIGLVMLAMLGLIGAVTFAVASLEERMSGNTRESMRAFEAAEASLRDCEAQIGGLGGLPAFDGSGGMYMAAAVSAMPLWQTVDWKDDGKVRVLATPLADLGRPPRCVVEQVAVIDEPPVDGAISMGQPRVAQTVFRVTSVGYGRSVTANAQLQSTFRRQ